MAVWLRVASTSTDAIFVPLASSARCAGTRTREATTVAPRVSATVVIAGSPPIAGGAPVAATLAASLESVPPLLHPTNVIPNIAAIANALILPPSVG
jgi:hypothetical protein